MILQRFVYNWNSKFCVCVVGCGVGIDNHTNIKKIIIINNNNNNRKCFLGLLLLEMYAKILL